MKLAETELNREIVSEGEWLVARNDLFDARKRIYSPARCAQRRPTEPPDGEDRQGLRIRRAGWQGNPGRSFRRAQSVDRLSFHVRSRLGRRLQKLLLSGGSL